MIKHLLKGILRDKSRSVLPIIIITIGVALTVLLSGYIKGAFGDMIDQNANFDTGHVKIMTKPYLENKALLPNDLALLGVGKLIDSIKKQTQNIYGQNAYDLVGLLMRWIQAESHKDKVQLLD